MTIEAVSMEHDGDVIEVPVSSLKVNPTKYTRLVEQGYRVYVTSHGERISALVAPEAADRLAADEDAYWSRRVADAEASGTVSWEAALADLEGGRA